jgi:hypothetical protein
VLAFLLDLILVCYYTVPLQDETYFVRASFDHVDQKFSRLDATQPQHATTNKTTRAPAKAAREATMTTAAATMSDKSAVQQTVSRSSLDRTAFKAARAHISAGARDPRYNYASTASALSVPQLPAFTAVKEQDKKRKQPAKNTSAASSAKGISGQGSTAAPGTPLLALDSMNGGKRTRKWVKVAPTAATSGSGDSAVGNMSLTGNAQVNFTYGHTM